MKLKIRLTNAKPDRFTKDGLTVEVKSGSGPTIELTTCYQEDTPDIDPLRVFVDGHGKIK